MQRLNFGGTEKYENDTKEHKFHKAGTTLKVWDDATTIRFVGYAVHRNSGLLKSFVADQQSNLESLYTMYADLA